MLKIEEAPEVQADIATAEIEEAAEKRTVASILHDLAQFIGDVPAEDAGLRAAMEIIKANYGG